MGKSYFIKKHSINIVWYAFPKRISGSGNEENIDILMWDCMRTEEEYCSYYVAIGTIENLSKKY